MRTMEGECAEVTFVFIKSRSVLTALPLLVELVQMGHLPVEEVMNRLLCQAARLLLNGCSDCMAKSPR